MKEKTHWLHNPNKAYLGHQDLPNGADVILTIASAAWEAVENKILNTKEEKRVIRFAETHKWVKPFICNATNAKLVVKVTGEKYIEDSVGKKLKIGISQTKVKKEEVDCLRIRDVGQADLTDYINGDQLRELLALCEKAGKEEASISSILNIGSFKELPLSKFASVKSKLNLTITQNANN